MHKAATRYDCDADHLILPKEANMKFPPISGRACGAALLFAPSETQRGASWQGYDDDLTRLDATITDLGMSNSHPSLQARARDGMNWTVELGDREQIRRAGLSDRDVAPGDKVEIQGHRASEFGDRRIKVSRLTIAGRSFEFDSDAYLEA